MLDKILEILGVDSRSTYLKSGRYCKKCGILLKKHTRTIKSNTKTGIQLSKKIHVYCPNAGVGEYGHSAFIWKE
jgi:hypothetical protein